MPNFAYNLISFPDLAGGRAKGKICSSKKIKFFGLAVTKFKRACAKLVRASRKFYVSVSYLCKLDTLQAIVICTFFAHSSVSSRLQKSRTFFLNGIKLFLVKKRKRCLAIKIRRGPMTFAYTETCQVSVCNSSMTLNKLK